MEYVKKKAQAAIEYLMNYTWLVAVLAMVGGTIFLLAGDQGVKQQISGFDDENVNVESAMISENQVNLQTSTRDDVEFTEIVLSDGEEEMSVVLDDSVSSSEVIEVCGVTSSDSGDVDVTLLYDRGGLENLTTSGTLDGAELSECLADVTVSLIEGDRNRQASEYSIPIGKNLYVYSIEGPPGLVGRINIIDEPEEFSDKKDLDIEVRGGSQPQKSHNYAMIAIEDEGVRENLYEDFLISESGSLNVTVDGRETLIELEEHSTEELNMNGVTTVEPFSCEIRFSGCSN